MFPPIPLTAIILNPNDCKDWDSSQNSGQDDYSDSSASDNLDCDNSDYTVTDDSYGNVNESSYNYDYSNRSGCEYNNSNYSQSNNAQVSNSDVTVHHKHRHYLVEPDSNYQSTDCYSDPQPEGYQEPSNSDSDCSYSDY